MKIGIIAAMTNELSFLLDRIPFDIITLKKNTFYTGEYGSHDLILVATGVGKVNAASYTQILIDHFNPDTLINIGIAGGLHPDLSVLDVVLGSEFSHHDVSEKQMNQLFPFTSRFKADQQLLHLCKQHPNIKMTGTIVSGEQFIQDDTEKENIINQFNPLAVDMETSAMAHTCFINDLPFVSLRCLSDLANNEADASYENNEHLACQRVGQTLLDLLKN